MGISGLLPLLKSIQKPTHLRSYKSQTLGVDTYGWLHRGTISCAQDLALGRPTTRYIDYVLSRVRMLQFFDVTPYLVFDGDYLPSKAHTEAERAERREQARLRGLELLKMGRGKEAQMELQKAVDVTPEMAAAVIEACRKVGVKCVVAPYEADAQLYYLEKMGEINGVISEDSDMLVFGVKKLITKLDGYGECVEVCRDDFTRCKEVSFVGWSDKEFRHMCILSGCDYLDNIPKLGLKTAHRLMRRHKDVEKILRVVQFEGSMRVPEGYLEAFRRADLTFRHQRVFDPTLGRLLMANEPEGELGDEDLIYIGPDIDEDVARGVAEGRLCPMTKREIVLNHGGKMGDLARSNSWAPKRTQQDMTVAPKNNKSITSFFKPKTEGKATPATPSTPTRKPLGVKSGNTPELHRAYSAPSKANQQTTASAHKRPLPWAATPLENKKPRVLPTNIDQDPSTGPKSEYFTVPRMRRVRPKLDPVPQPQFDKENIPPPSDIPKSVPEKQAPAIPALQKQTPATHAHQKQPLSPAVQSPATNVPEAEDTPPAPPTPKLRTFSTPTPSSSTSTPIWPPSSASTPATSSPPSSSLQKVAQGWKEKYAFQHNSSGKLSDIIKKQQSTPTPRRMTPLERMRAATTGRTPQPQTPSARSPQEDFWPDFVGTSSGRPRSLHQTPVAASGGGEGSGGLFGKFAYKR